MAQLIYSAITSLDLFVADERGNFDWAMPDHEVHQFINDLERPIGTYLYGRKMFETMQAWDSPGFGEDEPVTSDFAQLWHAADKIVYSTTLESATTARTRLERSFDPVLVRELKQSRDRDLTIGGPELASHAFEARLIDECRLFLNPVLVGAGRHALPAGVRAQLELLEERRFRSGVVYLRYAVKP